MRSKFSLLVRREVKGDRVMSYYRTINGIKMDGHLLDKANAAVARNMEGDSQGRISKKDAESIIIAVTYGFGYADVEEDTLKYIRDNYKWTESAGDWFKSQISNWLTRR
jgi:hypothetical protein